MRSKSPVRLSPAQQSERFKEAAKALGADESEAAFRERLAVIARQKPKDAPEAPRAKRKPK